MRKLVLMGVLVLLAALPVIAQETPKAEVFGGYSLVRSEGEILHGWNASVNGNMNDWFGIKGDFAGYYKTISGTKVKFHSFTFGPQLSYRKNEKVVVFAHALFGGAHISGGGISESGFAMNLGGGVDWVPHKNVAIRVIQADGLITRFGGSTSGDLRISAGIVFRFGSK